MRSASRLLLAALSSTEGLRTLLAAPLDEQQAVREVAAAGRVLPVLGGRLLAQGLATRLPDSFVQHLAAQPTLSKDLPTAAVMAYQANQQRTAAFRSQLCEVGRWFDDAGIAWLPLKGAALLLDDVWPDPAERVMTDLDLLLLDPAQAETAQNVLLQHGLTLPPPELRPVGGVLPDHHQLPALVRGDWVGSVELHTAFVMDEFEALFPTAEVLARVVPTSRGVRLSAADLALHTIFHAQISDWGQRSAALSLRAVLDVAHLVSADEGIVERVLAHAASNLHLQSAARGHLVAVGEVLGPRAPSSIDTRHWPRARRWWRLTLTANATARRHALWRQVALVGVFVRRNRVEARAGRALRLTQVPAAAAGQSVRRLVTLRRSRRVGFDETARR